MRWCLCALLLACYSALAANVYIRDGGSGSGAAWNDALDDLPATLTRGNTYYMADGTYAGYHFDDAESGATVITVKKATIADHGTSTGWLDTYGDGTATFTGGITFDRDYYVLDGVTRDESNPPESWTNSVYGFRGTDMAIWPDNFPPGGDHITVKYVEFGGAAGVNFGDPGFPADALVYIVKNASGTDITDFTLSHCYLHNGTLVKLSQVDTVVFEYTYMKDMWAKEAIRGDVVTKNFICRYNVIKNCVRDTGLPGEGGTAAIAIWDNDEGVGSFDNIEIYGNIFWDTLGTTHSGGAIILGGNGGGFPGVVSSNCKVYNNSIIGYTGAFTADVTFGSGTSGNEVRNNLWYDCIGTPAVNGSGVTVSNNGEQGSDPFTATGNFHLSAAISGTSLSSPYNTDLEGTTRGSDGTFDRGAFEYSAGGGGAAGTSASSGLSGRVDLRGNVIIR